MLNLTASVLASSLAAWRGTSAFGSRLQPELPLELYEFEGCPYCRLVREALTEMDEAVRQAVKQAQEAA